MTNTSQAGQKLDLLVPAVVVSIIIAIFAVVTQLLNVTSAASLSTTQMLTAWLVAVGLIALLWIAYMISSAYMNARAEEVEQARTAAAEATRQRDEALKAKDAAEQKAKHATRQPDEALKAKDAQDKAEQTPPATEATERLAEANPGGGSQRAESSRPGEDGGGWIPPGELRHLDGTGHHARTRQVFPAGCYLVAASGIPTRDMLSGELVFRCTVDDQNPELNGRGGATVVNVAQKPETEGWPRHPLVKFEDLQVIPYETEQDVAGGRMEYTLRAKEVQLAA